MSNDTQSVTIKAENLVIDPPINGQKFVCLSFVSPDDIIKKRLIFEVNKFLYNEINQHIVDQATFIVRDLNALRNKAFEKKLEQLKKNGIDKEVLNSINDVRKELEINEDDYANKCLRKYNMSLDECIAQFDVYQTEHHNELEDEFSTLNDNTTSVRGVKVRGVFNSKKEANDRCKFLRENVEQAHHVYVAPIGYWLPWDPSPDAIQDQDYMVPALNELMRKKIENMHQKNIHYEKRKREMIEQAAHTNEDNKTKQRLRDKLHKKKIEDAKPALN